MPAPLDDVLPVYQHRERHAISIAASPGEVWKALLAVTVGELRLSRTLMALRTLPARLSGTSNVLMSAPQQPFITAFLNGGFRKLRDERPRLLIAGAAGQPWRLRGGERSDVHNLQGFRTFARPGFVLMATSFELQVENGGTCLSTETRVQPTDPRAGRAFRPYWWVIRAGSGLIRRDVLQAVRRRAENRS